MPVRHKRNDGRAVPSSRSCWRELPADGRGGARRRSQPALVSPDGTHSGQPGAWSSGRSHDRIHVLARAEVAIASAT
jgi:hypothetical protein